MIKRDILLDFEALFWTRDIDYTIYFSKTNRHRFNRESAGGHLFARADNISKHPVLWAGCYFDECRTLLKVFRCSLDSDSNQKLSDGIDSCSGIGIEHHLLTLLVGLKSHFR